MAFFGQERSFTPGNAGRRGLTDDQCKPYPAPPAIHFSSNSISCAVSFLPDFGGGILSSGSSVVIRLTTSLFSGWLGTIALYPPKSASAPSGVSRRSPCPFFPPF